MCDPTLAASEPQQVRDQSSASSPRRLALGVLRNEFPDLHLVHAVEDLQISAGDRFDAPGRHQIGGIGIGVIEDVVDDVETRRTRINVLEFAAGPPLGARINRDTKLLKGFVEPMPIYRIEQRHRTRIIPEIYILFLDLHGFGKVVDAGYEVTNTGSDRAQLTNIASTRKDCVRLALTIAAGYSSVAR